MTTRERDRENPYRGWAHVGRAAEHFARRVARDARRFAERIEEHAGEFAHDVARDWQRAGRESRCGDAPRSASDVRRVFDDVRGVMADVLDGVDELIGRVFHSESEHDWARVVHNREVTCGACGRATPAGGEGYVRRTTAGTEVRCLDCGVPVEEPRAV